MTKSKLPKINILIAYPYWSKQIQSYLEKKNPKEFRLIIDSGAFSAWNSGKVISLDDYCKFLKTIPKEWDYNAVQLDVYGDPQKTFDNYNIMLDRGFTDIMPVFTRGDKLSQLDYFYKKTDYIMFGGIAIGGSNQNYVKWFCENNNNRKAHWLGFVNILFMKKYKPYSVDSSSIHNVSRFGVMQLYTSFGSITGIQKKEFKNINTKFIELFKLNGITKEEVKELRTDDAWKGKYDKDNKKGLFAYINYRSNLLRTIAIEQNLGTKVYHAIANDQQLKAIYQAHDEIIERKLYERH